MLDPKITRRIVKDAMARRYYGGGNIVDRGTRDFAANQSMGSHKLTNLAAPTAASSDAARISDVEAAALAAIAVLGVRVGCHVQRAAQQNNGASPAFVSFDTEVNDDGGMFAIGTPTRVTFPQTGDYCILGQLSIDDGAAGGAAGIKLNGTTVISYAEGVKGASLFGDTFPYIPLIVGRRRFTAGDYIEVITSGMNGAGAHNIKVNATAMNLYVTLLASNAVGGGDFLADGTVPMTGDLDFNTQKGINLAAPTADNDAARKKYVDDSITTAIAAIAPSGTFYSKAKSNRTAGNVAQPGSLTQLTGVQCVIAMSNPGEVTIYGTVGMTFNAGVAPGATVGIDVDGTQYTWVPINSGLGALLNFVGSFSITLTLAAGAHTIKLMHAGNGTSYANATTPACLTVDYQA